MVKGNKLKSLQGSLVKPSLTLLVSLAIRGWGYVPDKSHTENTKNCILGPRKANLG